MAGASLLALLDDITALLDDVALMTKTAASKTAGVLGDDLAVNAEQVTGMRAERELPVVWAVAKGSMINKAIIVPIALLLSAFLPWAILPILMFGGLYLCFEGAEKIFASDHANTGKESLNSLSAKELITFEKNKIKGAIRTDFVLSIEIIVITLGTVANASLLNQFTVLALIAIVATVGVYGIVALIVKLDDAGLWLFKQGQQQQNNGYEKIGLILINSAPHLMKLLTVVGTVAMFLVGGGILSHSIDIIGEYLSEFNHFLTQFVVNVSWLASLTNTIMPILLNGLLGLVAGGLLFMIIPKIQNIFTRRA
ncbi:MAG: hypothetical protein COB35_09480 [Gammaproteobacteria bacterium]|nr:MAG: hypothetical protein COB35_09480 [Gammaproteobacteria bacterium]